VNRSSCTVAAVQPDSSGTPAEALDDALRLTRRVIRSGAEIVCLPEHWIPGRRVNLNEIVPTFSRVARETGTYIVPGADFSSRRGITRIESPILGPHGEVGREAKTHLFRRENRMAIPGDSLRTFKIGGIRIGVAICHDLVYPEVARTLVIDGAELILVPAMITDAGYGPWELYVKARALENRVPIVSPNAVRPPAYHGGSLIVGFDVYRKEGIVEVRAIKRAGGRHGLIMAKLNLEAIRKYRTERLNARRPELYSRLSIPTSAPKSQEREF
jgi:omega-amidase